METFVIEVAVDDEDGKAVAFGAEVNRGVVSGERVPSKKSADYLDDERLRDRAAIAMFEVFPGPFTAADFLAKVSSLVNKPAAN